MVRSQNKKIGRERKNVGRTWVAALADPDLSGRWPILVKLASRVDLDSARASIILSRQLHNTAQSTVS